LNLLPYINLKYKISKIDKRTNREVLNNEYAEYEKQIVLLVSRNKTGNISLYEFNKTY